MKMKATQIEIFEIPLSKIRPMKDQPRSARDPLKLQDVAESIAEEGQRVPGLVKRLKPPVNGFEFELVKGERRFRACTIGKTGFFRAQIVKGPMDRKVQFETAADDNYGQERPGPMDTARLIKEYKGEPYNYPDKKIAAKLSMSVADVQKYFSLFRLAVPVQKLLDPSLPEVRQLDLSKALALTGVPSGFQLRFAQKIIGKEMTVSQTKSYVKGALKSEGYSPAKRSPERDFQIVSNSYENSLEQIRLYGGFGDDHVLKMLKSRNLQDRMKLYKDVEALVIEGNALRDRFKRLLKQILPTPE